MDSRTTLIIKNIPVKMTQERFGALVREGFAGRIDFLYVPHDFKTGGALGYAFINLKQLADVLPFYKHFHGFSLPKEQLEQSLVRRIRSHPGQG